MLLKGVVDVEMKVEEGAEVGKDEISERKSDEAYKGDIMEGVTRLSIRAGGDVLVGDVGSETTTSDSLAG